MKQDEQQQTSTMFSSSLFQMPLGERITGMKRQLPISSSASVTTRNSKFQLEGSKDWLEDYKQSHVDLDDYNRMKLFTVDLTEDESKMNDKNTIVPPSKDWIGQYTQSHVDLEEFPSLSSLPPLKSRSISRSIASNTMSNDYSTLPMTPSIDAAILEKIFTTSDDATRMKIRKLSSHEESNTSNSISQLKSTAQPWKALVSTLNNSSDKKTAVVKATASATTTTKSNWEAEYLSSLGPPYQTPSARTYLAAVAPSAAVVAPPVLSSDTDNKKNSNATALAAMTAMLNKKKGSSSSSKNPTAAVDDTVMMKSSDLQITSIPNTNDLIQIVLQSSDSSLSLTPKSPSMVDTPMMKSSDLQCTGSDFKESTLKESTNTNDSISLNNSSDQKTAVVKATASAPTTTKSSWEADYFSSLGPPYQTTSTKTHPAAVSPSSAVVAPPALSSDAGNKKNSNATALAAMTAMLNKKKDSSLSSKNPTAAVDDTVMMKSSDLQITSIPNTNDLIETALQSSYSSLSLTTKSPSMVDNPMTKSSDLQCTGNDIIQSGFIQSDLMQTFCSQSSSSSGMASALFPSFSSLSTLRSGSIASNKMRNDYTTLPMTPSIDAAMNALEIPMSYCCIASTGNNDKSMMDTTAELGKTHGAITAPMTATAQLTTPPLDTATMHAKEEKEEKEEPTTLNKIKNTVLSLFEKQRPSSAAATESKQEHPVAVEKKKVPPPSKPKYKKDERPSSGGRVRMNNTNNNDPHIHSMVTTIEARAHEIKAEAEAERKKREENKPKPRSLTLSRRTHEPEIKEYVNKPTDKDILLGRGGKSNHHLGNKAYRYRVGELRDWYRASEKNAKTDQAQMLVNWVKEQGGRFLKRDAKSGGKWYIVTNLVARRKASQALREHMTKEEREKAKNNNNKGNLTITSLQQDGDL